jgi:uncharacterized protein
MKRFSIFLLLFNLIAFQAFSQHEKGNTLLWKVSGNGLSKPSYIYGTMHLLCTDDAGLSENMVHALESCDEVYFEVDLNNLFDMLGAVGKMKMKGDTTLRDLLTGDEYQKVKNYFESKSSMLPFSMLESMKPMLASATIDEGNIHCDNTVMMEQVIMKKAKGFNKKIHGLETMAYQAGLLDSIPYKLQAAELVKYIDSAGSSDKEMEEMTKAYRDQDLGKLQQMMIDTDAGMSGFTDILVYHRNQNWVKKLKELMQDKSLVIAVGAGHLPGEKGVLDLLRGQGFNVTPVSNDTRRTKEI